MVEEWWKNGGRMVEEWWKNGGRMVEEWWKNGGRMVEEWWKINQNELKLNQEKWMLKWIDG